MTEPKKIRVEKKKIVELIGKYPSRYCPAIYIPDNTACINYIRREVEHDGIGKCCMACKLATLILLNMDKRGQNDRTKNRP